MASLTIRKLDEAIKASLRLRSARNGRSVEEEVRVILREYLEGGAELLQVARTGALPGRFPGPGEHREQNGGEDGDDRDHHQELDERKSVFSIGAAHGQVSPGLWSARRRARPVGGVLAI